ncbi:UNVERIFIED_CONTAM: hypothetical protein PYX00_000535 [Menopon gallinae]|uniref:Uncharacterized protein n=1 Tax=Menopon gallinae TaxID=328185 RepID=A0AAW2IBK0_9NEOP
MENDKVKILWKIKKLENEIQSEHLLEEELMRKIVHYKNFCLEIGEKVHKVLWRICQADFIYSCEYERRSNYLTKMEQSNLLIHKYELSDRSRDAKEKLNLKETLSEELEELRKLNAIKMESISKTETHCVTLKNRNAEIKEALMRKIEEGEAEEKRLEDMLDQIEDESEYFA